MATRTANVHEQRLRGTFLGRVAKVFGVRPAEAEAMLSQGLKSSVRVNRLSDLPADEILRRLGDQGAETRPIDWCPDAYHLISAKRDVAESDLFKQGHVYIQNASSLVPPLALAARPGESILDVCSAPGGKAAHIAALVGNGAELWLNDALRLAKLTDVVATFRVRAAHLTAIPGQYLTKQIDRQFDRILLDAQCSGEGMIDLSSPRPLRFWSMARVTKYSHLQEKMLTEAFKLLKPGGTLVYSTCTFAPEENEAPVDRLLRVMPEATIEPIEVDVPGARRGLGGWEGRSYDPRLAMAVRVTPAEYTEGFFVCKIVKRAGG